MCSGSTIIRNLFLCAVTVMMASCSTDDMTETDHHQPMAITFSVVGGDVTTRAAGEVGISDLQAGVGFGVFACQTGTAGYLLTTVTPDFMYNEKVYYQDGVWQYNPVKYWPSEEGQKVSFFAYAPYVSSPGASECIARLSEPDEQGDPYLVYVLAEDPFSTTKPQVDLLYATPLFDQTRPEDTSERLTFSFRHALTCAGDKVTLACSGPLQEAVRSKAAADDATVSLVIDRITIDYTLLSKARLSLNSPSGSPVWQPVVSGVQSVKRTVVLDGETSPVCQSDHGAAPTGSDITREGKGVFYIPMPESVSHVAQKAEVTVDYHVVSDGSLTYTGSVKNSFGLNSTEAGGKQNFAIRLISSIPLAE